MDAKVTESPTYKVCDGIRRILAQKAGEIITYSNWSNEYSGQELRTLLVRIKQMKDYKAIDPNELSVKEMDDLGFGRWSENSPLRLIPIWMFPFLADEFMCGSISSPVELTKLTDIDNDHRFGCLAYGVVPAGEDAGAHTADLDEEPEYTDSSPADCEPTEAPKDTHVPGHPSYCVCYKCRPR